MESMETHREFLKAHLWKRWRSLETDQKKQIPHPSIQKPYPEDADLIDLVASEDLAVGKMPLIKAINCRRSRRRFTEEPLTLEEFSFLLWATQGVREVVRDGIATRRTVPSAGARHPFETYLLVYRVNGLQPGLYRYLSLEHKVYLVCSYTELADKISNAWYIKDCAVVFIWTVIPYRTEWRYTIISPKLIALDAGHVCQNLYLACEAIGAGTCAIGAYDQDEMDTILGVDGKEEFTVYVAPAGNIE